MTLDHMTKYLGTPATALLSVRPFMDWTFEKTLEIDLDKPRIDYVFPDNGLDLICDGEDRIRTIFLYSDGHRRFDGDLADLPFSSTRKEVLDRLGAPSKSGGLINDPILGEFGPWDRFNKSVHSIHVEYDAHTDRIKKVTLMRAEAAP